MHRGCIFELLQLSLYFGAGECLIGWCLGCKDVIAFVLHLGRMGVRKHPCDGCVVVSRVQVLLGTSGLQRGRCFALVGLFSYKFSLLFCALVFLGL